VLAALAKGMLYKEIASQLKISEKHGAHLRQRIYEKLHVIPARAVAKFR